MQKAGVAEGIIMKIGGWRARSVFERYAIVSQSGTGEAIRRVEPATGIFSCTVRKTKSNLEHVPRIDNAFNRRGLRLVPGGGIEPP